MKESLYGELSVIGMRGCEDFAAQVDDYLKEWRRHDNVGVAECAIHNGQGVEYYVGECHGLGVDPSNGSGGLQSKTNLAREHHTEVVGYAHICQLLHTVNGATEVMTTM